jgi:hypothetical protein
MANKSVEKKHSETKKGGCHVAVYFRERLLFY